MCSIVSCLKWVLSTHNSVLLLSSYFGCNLCSYCSRKCLSKCENVLITTIKSLSIHDHRRIHISFCDITNMADFWGKLTPNPIEVNGNRMEFCHYFLTFPKNRYLNHLNTFPEHILTKFD